MNTNGIEMLNEAPGSTRREGEVAREALIANWFNVPGQEAMTEVVLQGTAQLPIRGRPVEDKKVLF